MKEYNVEFTVKMKARVRVEEKADLGDAISDIDIPENKQCQYVPDSFEQLSVREVNSSIGRV